MKISLNWLKELVDFDCSVEELAAVLTMRGLEVEHIENLGDKYKNFIVGEIFEMNKHPNAEKLSLCTVDIGKGKEKLKIVCGAPNAQEGQYVVVALVGATIPRDQHDPNGKPFVLAKTKIRGEDSNGMLCSKYELDLGDDADGIFVLEDKTVEKVGIPFANYLGVNDTVLEVGITPNRPDCLSHIGIAREIASHFKTKLELPSTYISEIKEQTKNYAAVRIEAEELCPRYSARVLKNVKVAPSPQWLQRRLEAVGVRPVNNVVDVTNYVMMETGQPLHAFDLEKVERETIVVKGAKEGELFTTLEGKQRKLKFETLMICDPKKSIAMAGILGGLNSEISETTKNVLIESAYFQARSIRRTSKYFGISTDASQRFERGTDPNITDYAATRAAQLMSELAGGDVLKGVLDVYPEKILPLKIALRVERTNQVLGTNLSYVEIRSLLESVDFEVAKGIRATKESLTFVIPSFRPDITAEIDLIEEVARIYGYDNIETRMRMSIQTTESIPPVDVIDMLRDYLDGTGWHEVIANSMQEKSIAQLGTDKIVEMLNPISSEMSALRTSLVPGLLQIIRHNIFHGTKNLRLFEIGRSYFHDPESLKSQFVSQYVEEEHLVFIATGNAMVPGWDVKERSVDIYDMKGEIETLLAKLQVGKFDIVTYPSSQKFSSPALLVRCNGEDIGWIGKIRSTILSQFDIEQDVLVADIDIDVLREQRRKEKKYDTLPKYPSVMRDFAFVVDEQQPVGAMEHTLHSLGGALVRSITLFDIYRGKGLPEKKKSCAFTLEFRSDDATLTDKQVEEHAKRIIKGMKDKLNATLRV